MFKEKYFFTQEINLSQKLKITKMYIHVGFFKKKILTGEKLVKQNKRGYK